MRRDLLRLTRAVDVTAAADADAPLPTEFRLFKAGVNESTKGPATLDAKGIAAVLAAFERGGVDLPIDLAHDSLNEEARANRNDADDARGWFRLEERDGELWAVGVTWTPDGEKRLRDRTQRYISPAFVADKDDRVVEIVNCALCSMPATLEAVPLVASRNAVGSLRDRERAVHDALKDRLCAGTDQEWVDVVDVFDDSVVYEWDGLLWRVGYSYSDKGAVLAAAAEQVRREYVPVAPIPALRKGSPMRAALGKEIAAWIRNSSAKRSTR